MTESMSVDDDALKIISDSSHATPIPFITAMPGLLRKDIVIIVKNPKAKAKTEVWQKFGLAQEKGSETMLPYAVSRNCKQVYSFKSSHQAGTSTLSKHLKDGCIAQTSKEGQQRISKFLPDAKNSVFPTQQKKHHHRRLRRPSCQGFAGFQCGRWEWL